MKGLVTYKSTRGYHEVYSVIAKRTLPADGWSLKHVSNSLDLAKWDMEGPDMPIKNLVLPLELL